MSAAARLAGSLAALLTVATLGTGCTDDDPSPAPPPSSASPSDSAPTGSVPSSPDPSSPDPSSSDATTSPEPTVVAAAGVLLEEETSQVNAPDDGWSRIPDVVNYASAVGRDATTEVITLSDRESYANPSSLEDQAKVHLSGLPKGAVVERMPDVDFDGAPAYYVKWYEKGDNVVQHDMGLERGGQVVVVNFNLDADDPEAAEALIATVLASFRWR